MQPIPAVGALSPWEPGAFSLIVYGLVILGFLALQLFLASWLGERKPTPEKSRPYESGIIPSGVARLQYPVPFYQVAIFFLIFDVEGAFIFAWAVIYKDVGWPGWLQMFLFIDVLLIGLLYIWKHGGLDWRAKYEA
ncbi:MAG: NADH-quinone oxidoreductase subunit A [Syntrophobacteraceae bacterium]|jgi:NADH-quinone oxidoreductase subunit A|nr:NADH-quinone oxidoreductase subunit A [Syntrophobacteraceae bacterium]